MHEILLRRIGTTSLVLLSLTFLLAPSAAGATVGSHAATQAPGVAAPVPPAASAGPDLTRSWKNVTTAVHPLARYGASMAYDAADQEVLLFGGDNSSVDDHPFNDTWTYSAGSWTRLSPATSPSAREFAAMTYDSADGYVVLFGGYFINRTSSGTVTLTLLNDTWTFSHGKWTKLTTSRAPPRCVFGEVTYDGATATFDSTVHAVLLEQYGCGYTWTFVKGVWTNITTSSSPKGFGSVIANDAKDNEAVFFEGGFVKSGGTAYTYSNSSWVKLPLLPTAFGSKVYLAMTYDKGLGNVLVFGGTSGTYIKNGYVSTVYNDTWRFSGGKWTEAVLSVSPPARYYASMAFDVKDGVAVLFGGLGSGTGLGYSTPPDLLSDTWTIG